MEWSHLLPPMIHLPLPASFLPAFIAFVLSGFLGLQAQVPAAGPALDQSFGSNGFSSVHFDVLPDAMARLRDGRILLAGTRTTESSSSMAVLRLNSDGQLDGTFGDAGMAIASFANPRARTQAIAVQPDGKILLAGLVDGPSTSDEYFVSPSATASSGVGKAGESDGDERPESRTRRRAERGGAGGCAK